MEEKDINIINEKKVDRQNKAYKRIRFSIYIFFSAVVLLFSLSFILQPIWYTWSNYDTMQGFYNEPDNTIQVALFGTSVVVTGCIPMEMYLQDGICAYNLGSEQQPMLGSYYRMEETYRLHKDTLKVVVLDCSFLRRTPDIAFYRKAIDGMH